MNIVLDTNIFVAACKGSRQSNYLMAKCLQGKCTPLMSAALLAEYEDVINRHEIFTDCPLNQTERHELLDAFLSVCQWVKIYYLWRPNLKDEADNHVLELAVAGRAEYLITHNLTDFMRGEMLFPHIKICPPDILLEYLS